MTEPTKEEIRQALVDMRRKEMKDVIHGAIKEWLSEQLAVFGWWSMKGIGAAALAALAYFLVWKAGLNHNGS